MLPTKFRFIWPSSFREDFLEIDQSETRIACGDLFGMFSIKNDHFVPIRLQTWVPQAIFFSDWSISK
jgi:hypothetical protein